MLLLFLLACALAAGMTWLRSGEPLGARISPPGWEVSFRPPRRFRPDPLPEQAGLDLRVFRGVTRQAVLAFVRIEGAHDDEARGGALRVLEMLGLRVSETSWSPEPFGPFEGAETLGLYGATVARVATVDSGLTYVAFLNTPDGGIEEYSYHLFDLTCRSVELTGR